MGTWTAPLKCKLPFKSSICAPCKKIPPRLQETLCTALQASLLRQKDGTDVTVLDKPSLRYRSTLCCVFRKVRIPTTPRYYATIATLAHVPLTTRKRERDLLRRGRVKGSSSCSFSVCQRRRDLTKSTERNMGAPLLALSSSSFLLFRKAVLAS